MIFVEASVDEWVKKFPTLRVMERSCDACGRTRRADKPWVSRDYAGLTMLPCQCGKSRSRAGCVVAISKEKLAEISEIVAYE